MQNGRPSNAICNANWACNTNVFIDFLLALRQAGIPASVRELLTLLDVLVRINTPDSVQAFYYLSRMTLVKDETHYDKFDRVFARFYDQLAARIDTANTIPGDWLTAELERQLTDAQKAQLGPLGLDKLLSRLAELLEEQKARHEGGNKWIGTGGTSPFGNSGYHPDGVRIGGTSKQHRAVKVWEQRLYKDYDSTQVLDTRQMAMALRRLRQFARAGLPEELALDETIRATAHNAGYLDIRMRAPRKNNVNILMLMDVGGSMDAYVAYTEQLFSAARSEFKQMDFFYFHNCVYDHLWKHNTRRLSERVPLWDVLNTYRPDTRLIFVGDAMMSPYEILAAGGAVDFNNQEAGAVWLQRLTKQFEHYVWLNPEPQQYWQFSQSIGVMQGLLAQRMYPLTLDGVTDAMRLLSR
jgi:uncharacterized protein with von Willebrand factor type A (vWA) domain